jgi:hypothetical protein
VEPTCGQNSNRLGDSGKRGGAVGIKQRIEKLERKTMAPKGIVVAFSEKEAAEKVREYCRVHLREPSKVVIFEDPFLSFRGKRRVESL